MTMTHESNRYSRYFTYVKPVFKAPIIKSYGTPVLTLIAMAIFIIFAIKPTVETILVLQKKIENSKVTLEKITKKSEDLSLARNNYKRLDSQIKARIQSYLPNKPDLKNLILELEQTALSHQSSISALQIQPITIEVEQSKKTNELSEVSFSFNVEGSYQNLLNLLKKVQNSTRIIAIDNLTINKPESANNLFMSITGRAYYLK